MCRARPAGGNAAPCRDVIDEKISDRTCPDDVRCRWWNDEALVFDVSSGSWSVDRNVASLECDESAVFRRPPRQIHAEIDASCDWHVFVFRMKRLDGRAARVPSTYKQSDANNGEKRGQGRNVQNGHGPGSTKRRVDAWRVTGGGGPSRCRFSV